MSDPIRPDFQDRPLPWVAKHEYVLDAHRGVIADLDPDCDRDETRSHALARFIAAAPETAEKLRELAEAVEALATYVDAYEWGRKWAGRPHAQMDAVRAALARARGA